jgi:hypothetical protein
MGTSIYCPIASHGTLANNGRSDMSGLPVVFTLEETAKLIKRGDQSFYQYQTDREGLRRAYYSAQHAQEAIGHAVEVLGKVFVHVDQKQLDDGDMGALGWLLANLGEISQQVNSASASFTKALIEGHHLKREAGETHDRQTPHA